MNLALVFVSMAGGRSKKPVGEKRRTKMTTNDDHKV
jgi:hypothetical protein